MKKLFKRFGKLINHIFLGTTNDLLYQQLVEIQKQNLLSKMGVLENNIFSFLYNDIIIKFYLPLILTDSLQQSILDNGFFYESSLLTKVKDFIPENAIIIDAGGNIGNHSIYFSKFYNAEKIYCFEPQKHIYSILQQNISLNNCSNVKLFNKALGLKEGFLFFDKMNIGNCGSSSFRNEDNSKTKLGYPVITIDSLGLGKVDLIKIDVEGSEYGVLLGAKELIKNSKPVIWIELNPWTSTNNEVLDFLKINSYTLVYKEGYNFIFEKMTITK